MSPCLSHPAGVERVGIFLRVGDTLVPMKTTCPHCHVAIFQKPERIAGLPLERLGNLEFVALRCPSCSEISVEMIQFDKTGFRIDRRHVFPRVHGRKPCPDEVVDEDRALAVCYEEACGVLSISPAASAALARRCMERVLVAKTSAAKGDWLHQQIDTAAESGVIPGSLVDSLHTLRRMGNYAAHPKPNPAGEIVEIEDGEAEFTLTVLYELLDVLYVIPARLAASRASFEEKRKGGSHGESS